LARTYYIYFGRIENEKLEDVARRAFDMFRFPLMALEIKFNGNGKWAVHNIEPLSVNDIPKEKHNFFADALDTFTGAAWRRVASKKEKYWIAILHDPKEAEPPSDKAALAKFARIGKDMNLFVELITKNDYSALLEYDALFIRETTAINHHTFRFALKAESEGIPCLDDIDSIIRCCNKVFLHELLRSHKIPMPRTMILDRRMEKSIEDMVEYPVVLKIPDGSFSRGIVKVEDPDDFKGAAQSLFKNSEIILAQEFVPSDFDWRIGVLNNQPLFACRYFMAKNHWQIYNHSAKRRGDRLGIYETVKIDDVPKNVMKMAVRAARLVGSGLYGVDLKETDQGVVVMEVNENPNIHQRIENAVIGDEMYRAILKHFVHMIEA
jgi:glutathione synthase/RimK-type ligase-like ATP-grasp enzyme